jgi:hypothetical protein
MGLNNQVKSAASGGSDRKFIFKEGIHYRHMTGKDPIVFRILPSFNPNDPNPATSYLPFMLPGDVLSDWGSVLYISRFIGHGKGGNGTRQDILSMRTGADKETFDPLTHLHKAISQMSADWGYLLEDVKDPTGKVRERAAFSKPLPHFICNVWDFNKPTAGAQLACFTSSAYMSMFNAKTGLVYLRINLVDESILQQNYLAAYAVGDLTDPVNGPALLCAKGNDNGEYSKYVVTLAQDQNGRIIKRVLGQDLLAQRYNLSQLDTVVNIPTEEEVIQALVGVLNMRGPHGYHEYSLLKQAFPTYRIPEPPAAPGAMPTVQSGFGANPAPIAQVAPAAPVAAAVSSAPPPPLSYAMPTVGAPLRPQMAPVVSSLPPPPYVPPVAAPVAPVAPVGVPAVTPSPEAMAAAANAVAAQPQVVLPNQLTPVAPGDDVGVKSFNKNDFLGRLQQMAGAAHK